MLQVRNIVSDDASEFEDMINKELEDIEEDDLKAIKFYPNDKWSFTALIIFREE